MDRYAGRRGKVKILEEYMRDEIKDAMNRVFTTQAPILIDLFQSVCYI